VFLLIAAAGVGAVIYYFAAPRAAPPIHVAPVTVAESFRTSAPHGESDSLAVFRDDVAGIAWLFVTDKHGDRLQIFDAAIGDYLRDLGTPGTFNRPNGVSAWTLDRATAAKSLGLGAGDRGLLFVVERDGKRVQTFGLPSLAVHASFGISELERPYGVAVESDDDGLPVVFITDNAQDEGQRVRRYEWRSEDEFGFACVRAFGDSSGAGLLRIVESIAYDRDLGRLYVCDESHRSRNVKVYSDDGRFLGMTFADGYIHREPEGIAIWEAEKGGWIIVTDQGEQLTTFHVFDRQTLRHVGAWIGSPNLANTDGIALTQGTLGPLLDGGLYAVHNDSVVAAYAWPSIRDALRLFPATSQIAPGGATHPER